MTLLFQQLANALVLGSTYVLVAAGLFLVFSVLHIPNFAHGEMFAFGAYFQYLLVVQWSWPFALALPFSALLVGLLGIVLERIVFRRLVRYDLHAVLAGSIALAIVLQEAIGMIWGHNPRTVPAPIAGTVEILDVRIASYRIVVFGLSLTACVVVGWVVYRSGFGRRMRALAQNRELSELSGVDATLIGTATFALGCVLAGFAGALLSAANSMVPTMGLHPMLVAFVILVTLGAGGRLLAVVLGGLTIAVLETLTAGYVSNELRTAVVFVGLIVFLILRPEGAVRHASTERAQL